MRILGIYRHQAEGKTLAMLKGFFERVVMPVVVIDFSEPYNVKPALTHINRISAVRTSAHPRCTALPMGYPPRKSMTRYTELLTAGRAGTDYRAQHPMNVATPERLSVFKATAGRATLRLA